MSADRRDFCRRSELAIHWRIVFASFIGVMMGGWSLPIYILGPLVLPLEAEHGWSPAQIMACLSFQAMGLAIGSPLYGKMLDRFPASVIAVASLLFVALGCAALGMLSGPAWLLQLLYFMIGLLGAGSGGMTYARAIGQHFQQQRGLAIGVALSGAGMASFVAPVAIQLAYTHFGIRGLGWALALLICVAAAIVALAGLDVKSCRSEGPVTAPDVVQSEGLTRKQALGDRRFYFILTAIVLFGLFISSLIVNVVPMLTKGGMSPMKAAGVASALGIANVVGKVGIGWLLDRVSAPLVGAAAFALGSLGGGVFLFAGPDLAIVMVVAIGLLIGAELDLLSYMTMRYFGLRSFGQIFGLIFAAYCAVSIVGPLIGGSIVTRQGYDALYGSAAIAYAFGTVMFILLYFGERRSGA